MTLAAGLAVLVVTACAIRLRGDKSAPQSSESLATDQVAAAKLEQCRSVTYEQKEALLECQRIWAEQRSRFLGESKLLDGSKSMAGTAPSSSAVLRKDESRLPSGSPSMPSQNE
nr:putative entry exclusion protein TrbK-alt [Bradyrhizobium diazoefficiens]